MKIELTVQELKQLMGRLSHEDFVAIVQKIMTEKKRGRPRKKRWQKY